MGEAAINSGLRSQTILTRDYSRLVIDRTTEHTERLGRNCCSEGLCRKCCLFLGIVKVSVGSTRALIQRHTSCQELGAIHHTTFSCNQTRAWFTYTATLSLQSTWLAIKQSQPPRIINGSLQYQRITVKYSGFVSQLSELIICKEAASRHQETTSRSQKRTPASDTKLSQAIHIRK